MTNPHHATPSGKPRARALGVPFDGVPGANNAITDVAGVEVGYTDDHPRRRGRSWSARARSAPGSRRSCRAATAGVATPVLRRDCFSLNGQR